MTTIKDMTYTAECDRCGRKLILASGYNALALAYNPEQATNMAAYDGWVLEANGDVECPACAVDLHGKHAGGDL